LDYEPRLAAARNVTAGKDPGYGTMTQWRDHASHSISPKLVYTSSQNPERGLKAFVLHDDWLVKVHGGTRQQFNYAGLHDPGKALRLDGLPNNLGTAACDLLRSVLLNGGQEDDLLFYIASLYNSRTARDFMRLGGKDQLHIPLDTTRYPVESIASLARAGREFRDLQWLRVVLGKTGRVDEGFAIQRLNGAATETIDLRPPPSTRSRFKEPSRQLQMGERTLNRIADAQARLQAVIDQLASDLYDL
jgi:hypothetical protein